MIKILSPIFLLLAMALAGCGGDNGGTNPPPPPTPSPRLVVDTTVTAPLMNDVNEAVWGLVDSVLVEIGGDPANYGFNSNLQKQNVNLKAIKKNDTLYVRARWKDNSAHLLANRLRRIAAQDTWEKGDLIGQDMFFIILDAGNNGTEKADCATMCHASGMATTGGGNADAWAWKSTATMPGNMAEDFWIKSTGSDTDQVINKYVYRNNYNFGQPYWIPRDSMNFTGLFLYLTDTVRYDPLNDSDLWPDNHILPGFVIDSSIYSDPARNTNSRNNVRAIAEYDSTGGSASNYTWTIIMSRALNTGKTDDVNLLPLDSIQVTIAATNNHFESDLTAKPEHSGSKPFYLILKPH